MLAQDVLYYAYLIAAMPFFGNLSGETTEENKFNRISVLSFLNK